MALRIRSQTKGLRNENVPFFFFYWHKGDRKNQSIPVDLKKMKLVR